MAISFVGSKTFGHSALTEQSCSLTDLKDESNNNATLLQNDIVIINYAGASAGVNRTNASMTPSGYTEFTSTDLYADDTYDCNQLVSYKIMGVTPDTTVDIPATDTTTNHGVAVTIYAFRGVDTTTPSDVTPTTATGANSGIANCPSITPSTAGAWIVGHGAAASSSGSAYTNPTGMSATTNHFQSLVYDPNIAAIVGTCLKTDWTSGAYDIAVFGGGSGSTLASWCATTIVLRPASEIISPTPPTTALGITTYAPTATGDPTLFEYISGSSTSAPTASTSIAITSTPPVFANIALLLISCDNSGGGADGDYSQVTGVTDTKGNSWHKLAEHSNTNGLAGSGATISAWYCEVDPNTFSSTITTATFSSSIAGRNIAIIYCRSETLSLYAAEILTAATDASTSYGSLSTSLAAKNRMYVRACAQESDTASGFTPTAGFTTIVGNTQAGSGANMGLRAELRIATSAAETSNPSSSFSSDTASVFIAIETAAAGGDGRQTAINTYSMTGVSDAADEVTQIIPISLGINVSTEDEVTQIIPISLGINVSTEDEVTQITPISLGANVNTADEVTQIVMYSITSQPIPTPETTVFGIASFAPSLASGAVTISPVTPPLTTTTYAPVITAEATTSVIVPTTPFGITTFEPTPPASIVVIVPTTELGITPRVPRILTPGTPGGDDCCCCCWEATVTVSVRFSARHSVR